MHDNETKEKFIELRAKGKAYAEIAETLGVSKQTLITWGQEFELQIGNLKAIENETLQEQYRISKQQRLKTLGDMAQSIDAELAKRNLDEVPTDKLIFLRLKLLDTMKDEATSTMFIVPKTIDEDLSLIGRRHLIA